MTKRTRGGSSPRSAATAVPLSRKKSLDRLTLFARLVYAHTKRIPKGRVSTYGLIAASIGRPRAFRAVGSALSANPFAPHVPCHRVVASGGGLGGFNGRTAPADCELRRKAAMLRAEGVAVDDAGRVLATAYVVCATGPGGAVEAAELEDGRLAAPMD